MTIYMVQHAFSRPDWEEEWNTWYGGNLKVLMVDTEILVVDYLLPYV